MKTESDNKINVGFLGYGTRALDALMEHPNFEVRHFFAPKARLNDDVYNAAERYKSSLTLKVVNGNDDLALALMGCRDVECFVMNACPIILNEKVLSLMPFYNVHPGDLRTNRGHQPHLWTVLLGESSSRIVLHKVNTSIDDGLVISSVEKSIYPEDNALDVLDKLEDEIPALLDKLYGCLKGDASPEGVIHGGNYRRIMTYTDYMIDFRQVGSPGFSLDAFVADMKRKILCRSMHHGAFFNHNNSRVYVDRLISCSGAPDQSGGYAMSVDASGNVRVLVGGYDFLFHLNSIQPGSVIK